MPKHQPFPTAVQWSHRILEARLHPGMQVMDATAGNGHDTLFLAKHVLPGGHVYAFDVQTQAIQSTAQRLEEEGIPSEGVTLFHAGHETLSANIPVAARGSLSAVMFNLGYLPGGDKSRITLEDTTLSALQQALDWLAEDGLLSVVVYPGHDGGREEAAAVESLLAALPSTLFEVQKISFLNYRTTTPYLMIARRKKFTGDELPLQTLP